MVSQPFDESSDPFLRFASEKPSAPTQTSEPSFLRIPAVGDVQDLFVSAAHERPSRTARVGLIATVSVAIGVLGGFAGGYVFARHPVAPESTSTALRVQPGDSQTPSTERPTEEAASGPNIIAPAPAPRSPTDAPPADVVSAPLPPTPVDVAPTPARITRLAATRRAAPAVVPTTTHGGAIEVSSSPRGAQVLLDGNVAGRAPLSIADLAEGTHEVRVELAGFTPWVVSVRVKDGSRARVLASLQP